MKHLKQKDSETHNYKVKYDNVVEEYELVNPDID